MDYERDNLDSLGDDLYTENPFPSEYEGGVDSKDLTSSGITRSGRAVIQDVEGGDPGGEYYV